jgi:hypothetical protein
MTYEELAPGVRLVRGARELAGDPQLWTIDLRDGQQLTVIAHAYSVEGEEVVFSLLFRGTPNFEVDALRLPLSLLPVGFS